MLIVNIAHYEVDKVITDFKSSVYILSHFDKGQC